MTRTILDLGKDCYDGDNHTQDQVEADEELVQFTVTWLKEVWTTIIIDLWSLQSLGWKKYGQQSSLTCEVYSHLAERSMDNIFINIIVTHYSATAVYFSLILMFFNLQILRKGMTTNYCVALACFSTKPNLHTGLLKSSTQGDRYKVTLFHMRHFHARSIYQGTLQS